MATPDPLVVDLIELAALLPARGISGRLGMCRLPGYEPAELGLDIAQLQAIGAHVVFTLNKSDELYFLPGLMDAGVGFFPAMARASFRHRHHAIGNGGVPAELAAFSRLVDEACEALRGGQTIVIHCIRGHGRTGLMAACCLVNFGLTAADAMAVVRAVRPGTIENDSQEAYVHYFARHARAPA
jgi:hypothetical protein